MPVVYYTADGKPIIAQPGTTVDPPAYTPSVSPYIIHNSHLKVNYVNIIYIYIYIYQVYT